MRCRTCGAPLPPGARACPNCGTAVPGPNETVLDTSTPPIPPTIYGGPPSMPSAPNYDPAIQNPYDRPSQPQASPQANLFPPAAFNQNQGVPNQYPNQYPQGNALPNYPPPGYMPPQQPPRRKTNVGLIIGVIAGVLVLACIASTVIGFGALYQIGKTAVAHSTAIASSSNTTDTTPAATNTTPAATDTTPAAVADTNGASPSGMAIDPNAASIITNAQSASMIDDTTAAPKDTVNTFKPGERFYITFKLNGDKVDLTTQKVYVNAKLYFDNVLDATATPITFDRPSPGGYFAGTHKAAGKGTFELYLCYKADCSDEKLAQVLNFTVSSL